MSSLPTIESIIGYLIAGGIVAIFILVWRVAVRIEGRIARLEERMNNLEENPFFVAVREFQIAQLKQIFNPEDMLNWWEKSMKNNLPKGGQNTS